MAAQSLWSEFRARIRTLRGWRKVAQMLGDPRSWYRAPRRAAGEAAKPAQPRWASVRPQGRSEQVSGAGVERGSAADARNFAETLRVWLSNAPPSNGLLHRCLAIRTNTHVGRTHSHAGAARRRNRTGE